MEGYIGAQRARVSPNLFLFLKKMNGGKGQTDLGEKKIAAVLFY
jgi:hypothetical protein